MPLRSDPSPQIGPPEYARVTAVRPLNIREGETRVERAAWALMTLDPIIVASMTFGVEDDLGRSRLSEYDLALSSGESVTVRSRYVVPVGRCVMLRRPIGAGNVVIVAQDEARCSSEPPLPVVSP